MVGNILLRVCRNFSGNAALVVLIWCLLLMGVAYIYQVMKGSNCHHLYVILIIIEGIVRVLLPA